MQKTTYKVLAESRVEFESILARFGLEISPDAWLHHAYHIVVTLSEIYTDAIRMEGFKQKYKDGAIYFALHDVAILHDILPLLNHVDSNVLAGKLKRLLRMESLPLESLANNEARNTLWELDLYARLKGVNVQAELGKPNPDILVKFGSRKYYIQCKRLYSPKETALRRNIAKAAEQLRVDLAPEGDNALGILALSIERPIIGGTHMLVTGSEQASRERLKSILEEFRLRYGYIWQEPDIIQDRRIVAIVLHLVTPGVVEDQNIFITGSQTDINNTWTSGAGFRKVMSDFGSLKHSLQY